MPYLITVTALWAFSFSLIGEYLAGKVDSDFAVLLRVLVAAALFLPFTTWRGLPRRLLGGFWLAGALQFGVTYLCLYRSFHVLTVARSLAVYRTDTDLRHLAGRRPIAPAQPLGTVGRSSGGGWRHHHPLPAADGGFTSPVSWLLQLANLTFAAGQVLCRRLLQRYPTAVPLHRLFGHFFLGAMLLALPSFLLFGDSSRLPHTSLQWGVLLYMGVFATALGMYWWVKGSTRVSAGTLAIMNELHVPGGLLVNVLLWHRDTDLQRLALGGGVILLSLWLNSLGRPRQAA